jgi:hypothetical protein
VGGRRTTEPRRSIDATDVANNGFPPQFWSSSMSSRADEYLLYAKECADAAERTTDPKVREMLPTVVADLTAAALAAASSGSTPPKPGGPRRAA